MALLAQPWPPDLDPKRVPFRRRTITTLQHMGALDDLTLFDELSVADVAGFWVTGPVTVADLLETGETAISWHQRESKHLALVAKDEPWTRHVWRRDHRFTDLLPRVDRTVYDIATTGHHDAQRLLHRTLPLLRARLAEFAAEPRDEALIRYVSANTGQSRLRTVALLQRLELLSPAINGGEAARQLGVSPQRIHQLVGHIRNRIEQAQPPGPSAAWFPQDPAAIQAIFEPANTRDRALGDQ